MLKARVAWITILTLMGQEYSLLSLPITCSNCVWVWVCVYFLYFLMLIFSSMTGLTDFDQFAHIRSWESHFWIPAWLSHTQWTPPMYVECNIFVVCTNNPFVSGIQSSKLTHNMSPYHLQDRVWSCAHAMEACVYMCMCVRSSCCFCLHVWADRNGNR